MDYKTLENTILALAKAEKRIKLLERRVDTLFIVVWIVVICELIKILF